MLHKQHCALPSLFNSETKKQENVYELVEQLPKLLHATEPVVASEVHFIDYAAPPKITAFPLNVWAEESQHKADIIII